MDFDIDFLTIEKCTALLIHIVTMSIPAIRY